MKRCVSFLLVLVLSSCISNKRINYLQNLKENESLGLDEFIPYASVDYEYVLQPFDIVDIDFASANEDLLKAFEFRGSANMRMVSGSNVEGSNGFYYSGYSINKDGLVRIPVIGEIPIAGLTEEKARIKIENAVNQFFKEEVYIRLRTGGIRFTAIGEFRNTGIKVILKNRATIFDALAVSGDPNLLAKRNQLFLIRQYEEGSRIHQINLNDRELLASPYYFIQPNDILYLQPMKIRQIGSGDNFAASLQLGASVITAVLLLYGFTSGIF